MHDLTGDDPLLPHERECVRFTVSGHRAPLTGVYEDHSFRSHWAVYRMAEVSAWCSVGATSAGPPPEAAGEHRYGSERPMRGG